LSEISALGAVLCYFHSDNWPQHIASDSQGNVFANNIGYPDGIELYGAGLSPRGVIIHKNQLNGGPPNSLCYIEHRGQLLVAVNGVDSIHSVMVFDVLE